VEFSLNGTLLVSGSYDQTVKLWDVQTGGVIKTFSGHTDWVWYVSISVDCTKIISGSEDEIIHLWDIQTGECYYTIEGYGIVHYVGFSPTNPQHFVSVFTDKTNIDRIWQWDTNGQQIKPPCDGSGVAFSPDGTQFVSYYKAVVIVWDLNSGAVVSTFNVGDDYTRCCCFSPDGRLVAVAASRSIYIWDITSSDPHLTRTFIGHTNDITSIVFSSPSTLISTSHDKSVKFWQVYPSSVEPVITSPDSTPISLPLVSSISLQIRDGIAISSDTAGIVKTWDIPTSPLGVPTQSFTEHPKYVDTKLVNSRIIFVWYVDEMLNIWNAVEKVFILQLRIPKHNTLDLRVSGDGSKVFHIQCEFIQAWDIWTGTATGYVEYKDHVIYKDYDDVELLAVDGSRIWIEYSIRGHIARAFCGWDFRKQDTSPVRLNGSPPTQLYLSNTKFWDTDLHRILDTVTGTVVFQLPTQFGRPVDVKQNSQYLVISFVSKEELVLVLHPTLLQ
jgi:WD40 repeat protein